MFKLASQFALLFSSAYIRYASLSKRFCCLLALVLLWSASSQAHLLNMSRVQISLLDKGLIQADFNLDLSREMGSNLAYYEISHSRTAVDDPEFVALVARLKQASVLEFNGQTLAWQLAQVEFADNPRDDFFNGLAWPMTHIRLRCQLIDSVPVTASQPGASQQSALSVTFTSQFLFEEPIALTFIDSASGRKMSRWLVPNQRSPQFAVSEAGADAVNDGQLTNDWQWQVWADYLYLGLKHIVPLGWDHVLFVLGLFLGCKTNRSLLWLITGFTLAHSFTLIMSSYGAISLAAALVEPLIAASIFWVAVENILFRRAKNWRIVTVFLFGLLHGLGFAQALRELGLPTDSFIACLISFNLGVELGQILVVGVAFALVGWARQRAYWRPIIVIPGSMTIALVALYWTLTRLLF